MIAVSTSDLAQPEHFPRTRYQGSKRRFAAAIVNHLRKLDYETVLDAFGGTGAVAYAFKCAGYAVTYNDILSFNHQFGLALIENNDTTLSLRDADRLGVRRRRVVYDDFIEQTFDGVYFTQQENRWLDQAAKNIANLHGKYERAIAWFAVSQAALAKRPYNLFHRRNLYMRLAKVPRTFGNKASWDRSFRDHVRAFVLEANRAIFSSARQCQAIRRDIRELSSNFDLVYLDPPYINGSGVGVNYRDFYHFLEGLVEYDAWPARVDYTSAHRTLRRQPHDWSNPAIAPKRFQECLEHFSKCQLAVSYRSDGIPSIAELARMIRRVKGRVKIIDLAARQYALSTRTRTREVLLIGTREMNGPRSR
ncbi:MAG: DNA adenine methylase [Planctomycetota bacterium]